MRVVSRTVSRTLLSLIIISLLSACSYFRFPGVHKVPVQQGNIITQDMIDQLRPGMTRAQVRFIMGTPLVTDTFNQNRWDYFYSLVDRDGDEVRERAIIFFENDKLTRISGDYVPGGATTTAAESTDTE